MPQPYGFILRGSAISAEDWQHCLRSWESSSRLVELLLDIVAFFPMAPRRPSQNGLAAGSEAKEFKLSIRMLTLRLHGVSYSHEIAFLKICPELVRLSWRTHFHSCPHLIKGLKAGHWPKMNRLELNMTEDESLLN